QGGRRDDRLRRHLSGPRTLSSAAPPRPRRSGAAVVVPCVSRACPVRVPPVSRPSLVPVSTAHRSAGVRLPLGPLSPPDGFPAASFTSGPLRGFGSGPDTGLGAAERVGRAMQDSAQRRGRVSGAEEHAEV